MENKIKFYFSICASDRYPYHSFSLFSDDFETHNVLSGFFYHFDTRQKIEHANFIINQPDLDYRGLGANDDHILVENDFVYFDYMCDKSGIQFEKLYPYKMPVTVFQSFLEEAKSFLIKYEDHRIPGLIPRKDFLDWTTAPNDEISKEYLKRKEDVYKSILKEVGLEDINKEITSIMRSSPQLEEDLVNQLKMSQGNGVIMGCIQRALREVVLQNEYSGYLNSRVKVCIVNYKIEEYGLSKSIVYRIHERIGSKDVDIVALDNVLSSWAAKINDKVLISNLAASIGLSGSERSLSKIFKEYPNVLVELEELLPEHTEELSKKFIRDILNGMNSTSHSESLTARFKSKLIDYLVEKYQLPNDMWKSSEELRQWSFKNAWNLTALEQYINEHMITR